MATATTDVETQEVTETETNTRKRIDPSTLDPNAKVIVSFHVPAGMRVAMRKAAEEGKVTEAEWARNLLAQNLEYTIPDSFIERKGRASVKYAGMTEEEKKLAIKAENDAKRDNVTNLLRLAHSGKIPEDMLAALGIDLSALPKPREEDNKQ